MQRFACSRAGLAKYLNQKLRRTLTKEESDLRDQIIQDHIPPLIIRLESYGYLNDSAYAASLARRLVREGRSLPIIRQRMQEKGVEKEDMEAAITALQEGMDDNMTLISAVRLMQRRRIGCFTSPGKEDLPEKAVGILARGGFDYGTIRAVLALSEREAQDVLARLNNA